MDIVSTIGYIWLFSGIIALLSSAWLVINGLRKKPLNKQLMMTCTLSFFMFIGLGYLIWFVIWPEFKKH